MTIKRATFAWIIAGIPATVVLSIIAGYRVDSGSDYQNYLLIHSYISEHGYLPVFEPFFYYLYQIGGSYNNANFLVALVSTGAAIWTIFRFTRAPWVGLYFFIILTIGWLTQFNIVRQSMAMPFVLLAFMYMAYGSSKKSLVAAVFAIFSHYPSVIVLSMIYVVPRRNVGLLLLASILAVVYGLSIGDVFDSLLRPLFSVLPSKFGNYTYHEYSASSYGFRFVLDAVWFIVIVHVLKNRNDPVLNRVQMLVFIGLLLAFVGLSSPIVFRLAYFFLFFQIILYAFVFDQRYIPSKKTRWVLGGSIALYYLAIFIYSLARNIYDIFPYGNALID